MHPESAITLETFSQFLVSSDRIPDPGRAECMDDRLKAMGATAIVGPQFGASLYGLTVDAAVGHVITTGTLPNNPPDELAKSVANVLEGPQKDGNDDPSAKRVFASEVHISCASEGDMENGVDEIAGSTKSEIEDALTDIGVDPDRHNLPGAMKAYRQVARADLVKPPEEAAISLTTGRQRFPRVGLAGPHVAGDIIMDWRPDGGYDKSAAASAGLHAYRVSTGRLPRYAVRISSGKTGLAVTAPNLVTVSLIRHGFLFRKLPVPASNAGGKLRIHHTGAY